MSSPTPTLTLGVVGHVDHGKTALVRALTGIETDRLAEERERGLSIVLGFAHLATGGTTIDLVDAPGHEAFIRAMIAGATGLDGVLLIVAANEGVQPQTREHFAIARLLDLRCGLIVLTKTDLVDAAQLARVRGDIEQLVAGTFLETAPIVPVSAVTGEGLAELVAAITRLPVREWTGADPRPFCLPLDRVFTMRGFGVVGTGTVRSGRVAVSDEVEILPGQRAASVRGLQVHGRAVAAAHAGQRVAVNLRGIAHEQLERGDWLAAAGALTPTARIDALLEVLPDVETALKNGAALRLLIGTTDLPVKLRLLDATELAGGAAGLVQLRCESAVVCQRGERFVVRSDSPSRTLGGGRVIEPHAPRRRRFDDDELRTLRQAGSASAAERVARIVVAADRAGIAASAIRAQADVDAAALERIAAELDAEWIGDRLIMRAAASRVVDDIRKCIGAYHAEHPMRRGLSISELASGLGAAVGTDILKWSLATLRERGEITGPSDRIRLASFDPLATLSENQRKLAQRLAEEFLGRGVEPPPLYEIAARGKPAQSILGLLLETGELVKLQSTDRTRPTAIHADVLQEVQSKLAGRYPHPAQFAVKDVRDLLHSSRKYVVPILEHLDAIGFTLRLGDHRQLRIDSGGE